MAVADTKYIVTACAVGLTHLRWPSPEIRGPDRKGSRPQIVPEFTHF